MAQQAKPLSNITDQLADLPAFPSNIYQNLPQMLQKGVEAFESDRQKDVFLVGALVVWSGFLDNTQGVYLGERLYPNINAFVVAPASGGKSIFKHAKAYGALAHAQLLAESRALAREYYLQKQKSKKDLDKTMKDPLAPPLRMGFIPGDVTAAALIARMEDNGGKGVIFETEADCISNKLKDKHGGHDAIFRQTFHHETVSVSRKNMNEHIEINLPRLSIGTTGTPDQVLPLISSTENGLFSRFCFYMYSQESEFRGMSNKSHKLNKTDYFKGIEAEGYAVLKFAAAHPTEFSFTPEQEKRFDGQFSVWLKETIGTYGRDAESIIYRLGTITFRIAMILSAIRKAEEQIKEKDLTCADMDFETALSLAEVFKTHATFLYSRFAPPVVQRVQDKGMLQFFELLPTRFKRAEAVAIADQHGIPLGTCNTYLNKMVSNKLIARPDDKEWTYGEYIKLEDKSHK